MLALLVAVFDCVEVLGRARVLAFIAVYSRSISCMNVVDHASDTLASSICSLACDSADASSQLQRLEGVL